MNTTALAEQRVESIFTTEESVIRFEEGLIGFSDCKNFVVLEGDNIAPFRLLKSLDNPDLGFLVIDPAIVDKDYYRLIPEREWESLGLDDPAAKLALAICIIGTTPTESTGNFQAPILINYKKMIGRQVILTEATLSVRQPLI